MKDLALLALTGLCLTIMAYLHFTRPQKQNRWPQRLAYLR